jgi:hypothetical protein
MQDGTGSSSRNGIQTADVLMRKEQVECASASNLVLSPPVPVDVVDLGTEEPCNARGMTHMS